MAVRKVDERNTAELRARTIEALSRVGIQCSTPGTILKVSPGTDSRIWLSLSLNPDSDEPHRRELAGRIVSALTAAGLQLESTSMPEAPDSAERLANGKP